MDLRAAFDVPTPAIVLAEGAFGEPGGKTAHGVVLHSELFDAAAVVDSTRAKTMAGDVLDASIGTDVPVVATMDKALNRVPNAEALIIGVAPAGGTLPAAWVTDIEAAVAAGCSVVSGLHVGLSEDPQWQAAADEAGVELYDIRQPPAADKLRVADGRVDELEVPVVLTMGTDCAVGKRTTTVELCRAARAHGFDAGWVATGQTGIMIGAHAGTVIDRVPADFAAGEVEKLVCAVAEDHELVFVEGQAALSHRAYSGVTLSILHGAWPDAVVLADDPSREARTHYKMFDVWGLERERTFIEALADTSVVAVSTWGDQAAVTNEHGVTAGNVYTDTGTERILETVLTEVR